MTAALCTGAAAVRQGRDAWEWPALPIAVTTLANGLCVVFAENRTVPLVILSWTADAGIVMDPQGLEGVASATPLLLRAGTARRSAERIAEELEELGTEATAGADWDSAFVNVGVLSSDFAAGVDLLFDLACSAQFPPAAATRLQRRRLAEIARRRREPGTLATDEFARGLFGPAGYGRPPLGTPESVQRIESAHVVGFHHEHYRPATSCLVVAGNVDREAAARLLASYELPPANGAIAPPAWTALSPAQPLRGVRIVDLPGAAQAEIRTGHVGVRQDSEDLPALEVLNAVLGLGPSSRLAGCLRYQDGLAYQVYSRFLARRFAGIFVVETRVAAGAAGAAVAAVRREMELLRDELVPAGELEDAKRRLLGAELRRWQDVVATGVTLGAAALHGDPVRGFERRRRAVSEVEPHALREVARRSLRPEHLLTVAVGPAEVLRSQFPSGEAELHARTLDTIS